ncbi:MAG: glycosyltransferase family 9 protein [Pseudomonadota bacterium]
MLSPDMFASPPRRVLIVSLRYLGDLLISTLMADGVKQRWPNCKVDYLVFDGMQGVLAGNGCVDHIITLPPKARPKVRLALLRSLWRQYDLALTSHSGDYPHLVLWAASRQRIGALPQIRKHAWWKRLSAPLSIAEQLHQPIAGLCARIVGQSGVNTPVRIRPPQASQPWPPQAALMAAGQAYAVLNPCPRWAYKRWHQSGWLALVAHLQLRGLKVVICGGHSQDEKDYLAWLFEGVAGLTYTDPTVDFAQSATLIAGASLFVGPDTFTTHLAASCGVPTVALFGPTDPQVWGPISQVDAGDASRTQPFVAVADVQQRANVWLLQNASLPCVPCQLEGCDRHRQSRSQCLDEMSAEKVLAVVDAVLNRIA